MLRELKRCDDTPFALVAHLRTPVIVTDNTWLTLDSLLSAAVTSENGAWSPDDIPLQSAGGLFLGSAPFSSNRDPPSTPSSRP